MFYFDPNSPNSSFQEFFPRNRFPVGFVVTPAPPYRPPSPEVSPIINSEPPGDEVDFPQDMDVEPSPRSPSYVPETDNEEPV